MNSIRTHNNQHLSNKPTVAIYDYPPSYRVFELVDPTFSGCTNRYLPYRIPEKDVMDSWIFGLLGDYFGLRYRSMVEGAIPQLDSKGSKKKKRKMLKERNKEQGKDKKTYMLAQMPHGIMVSEIPYILILYCTHCKRYTLCWQRGA